MRRRIDITGAALMSIVATTAVLIPSTAQAEPSSNPEAAYCHDIAVLGHRANCANLASYGHGVCAQFDKGIDYRTILQQLDTVTADQQFSADILVVAVRDLCPWNEAKKP
jgi:hypothetical protein